MFDMFKNLLMVRTSNRFTLIGILLLCAVMIMPITASAAHYNTYTTFVTLPNGGGDCCAASQGFAVGSTYAYSIKTNSDDTKAVIYKTTLSNGTTTLMTNGDDGTTYATYLGHANDMTLATINGDTFMFIVTMKQGSLSLVKLKYVYSTFYKVGEYTIKLDGVNKSAFGVAITSKDTNNINFLFAIGDRFYRGALPLTANSGTINVTDGFGINKVDALVNGSTVSNISSYVRQGFGYDNNTLYLPLTYHNISIVLVYHNISTATGTLYADDNLSFRITSAAYPHTFEIESLGVDSAGKLWFNANRQTDANDKAHDGVFYFNGYVAP
jgi:hypothetical protein